MGTLKDWTTAAADNDDADPTINWQEGQAPSTVNNSGRAMMAAVATQYREGTWHWVETSSVSCSVASQSVFRLGASGGDVTAAFHAGRRVRLTGGSTTRYASIISASYTSETSVTIAPDSGSLSVSHNTVALGPVMTGGTPIPGWRVLEDTSLSAVASFTLDGIPASVSQLRARFTARLATDGATLRLVLRKGSGADVTAHFVSDITSANGTVTAAVDGTATSVPLSGAIDNTGGSGTTDGQIEIFNLQGADRKGGYCTGGYRENGVDQYAWHAVAFQANDAAAITGIKLVPSAGNIMIGRVLVEGR